MSTPFATSVTSATTASANPAATSSSSLPSSSSPSHPPLLQPILFCGHGNNLYPLCQPTLSSVSTNPSQSTPSLPKALLPILNRPLISFPLQYLLSAGLRHAILLAPSEQHHQIAHALRSISLVPPQLSNTKGSKAQREQQPSNDDPSHRSPNLSVNVGLGTGLSSTTDSVPPLSGGAPPPASLSSSTASSAVMRVDLLPLGPDDSAASSSNSRSSMGTAQLLSWLAKIGRLDRDPLILPLDFIAPNLPLSTLINSHISGIPDSPMVTCIMYERGAGEGTGKEREKDGPPKLFTAYDRVPLPSPSSSRTEDASSQSTHQLHRLLLLLDSDDITDVDSSDLHLRTSMLWKHPHTRISTSLLDSHVYILNMKRVLPLLEAHPEMTSLREHVLPFIVKCSWQHGLREKVGWNSNSSSSSSAFASNKTKLASSSASPQWLSETSRDTGVKRSTTYLEPDLLEPRYGGAGDARRSFNIDGSSGTMGSPPSKSAAETLYTPELSRAPSPGIRGTASDGERRRADDRGSAVVDVRDGKAGGSSSAEKRMALRKSAEEARVVAIVAKLRPERSRPIPAGVTVEEEREREAMVESESGARSRFVARANTVPTYMECNRHLLKALLSNQPLPPLPFQSGVGTLGGGGGGEQGAPPTPSTTASAATTPASGNLPLIDAKAQVSADTLVGEGTRIGERSMLKRSIIGRNCTISKNARIVGCILMDACFVGDGVKLENCILCPKSKVMERSNLKDCDVGFAVEVSKETSSKNEKFDD
ncbi:hypothetical protein IE53DRAFT_338777 [Violaceomyces palustris]|uniref:Uncharacterized protein n=1 Tax=Violaceomyces palustris TaxID=1673888 RepID=A0ACD0P5S3_9BASI|nr:hypothetical protein IE53DRAFT_338777 [Violaceomyces palustris]